MTTYELPPEPGPEVTRLRMVDDEGPLEDTFTRVETGWREDYNGSVWRWGQLLVKAENAHARLVDATQDTTP
jgi:hypothetical protein